MQEQASLVTDGEAVRGSAARNDRAVLAVGGADAERLLQDIVTQDLGLLSAQPAIYAALLTPQGKIIADFCIVRGPDGLLLDLARDRLADVVKRLTLYRLRAKVTFTDVSDRLGVAVAWGGSDLATAEGAIAFPDPRLPALGVRAVVPRSVLARMPDDAAAWHAHRIACGVPEGGLDFAYGDTFPHEADMDQLAGVSFTKGCFIGQEVVSRMQHRGTARKRIVQIRADAELTAGTDVRAGDAVLGTVGSVAGRRGLALLRLDRLAEAEAQGLPVRAGDVPVRVEIPIWARFAIAASAAPGLES